MTDEEMKKTLEQALREVEDPETGISVFDLGLIYDVRCELPRGEVEVAMTLTSRACPAGDMILLGVERRLRAVPGVSYVEVRLVFEPPWTPARITPDGRAALGW